MIITPIVDRIASQVPAAVTVRAAQSLEPPVAALDELPLVEVVPVGEESVATEPRTLDETAWVTRLSRFSVRTTVYADDGDPDAITVLRNAIETALNGWSPQTGYSACAWESGAAVALEGQVTVWDDTYSMSRHL